MREYAAEEIEKATVALSDAQVLMKGNGTDTAVVNRLYCACFHAATGALYAFGEDPNSHRGTIALFGSQLVVDGPATRDDGRFLNRMKDYREQADYGYDDITADTDALYTRTEAFVDSMKTIVEQRGDGEPCA
ncbi:HEPN domain-containing protein [Haloterrigena alkaliphila]|uniref:HEPN domain-containing protein n=1 Tax=Haloterrigena alkaliphila TaxID=2816475 RepID=A0A8A2VFK6_9EURY|nr:HEPN domain-containing protein [Haloterrigena alkaliphila]QSX00302.1 HEPN domain-containing protein [Haloterrigena alkaliphila]